MVGRRERKKIAIQTSDKEVRDSEIFSTFTFDTHLSLCASRSSYTSFGAVVVEVNLILTDVAVSQC
jgi:hypothetical protein